MTSKYRSKTPDIIEEIADLRARLSRLERTPQLPHAGVDTGGVAVTGDDGSSFSILSGDQLDPDLVGFYNFFNRDVYVAKVWSLGSSEDYVFEALTRSFGLDNTALSWSWGAKNGGIVTHKADFSIGMLAAADAFLWFGLLGTTEVGIGSSLFSGSRLMLQNAKITLNGFPNQNILLPNNYLYAACDADLTLSTTSTAVSGCSIGFLTAYPCDVEIVGVFDFDCTVAGSALCIGELSFDGAAVESQNALFDVTATTDRATVVQQWKKSVSTGSDLVTHTAALQARKSTASGTMVARATHTTISVKTYVP